MSTAGWRWHEDPRRVVSAASEEVTKVSKNRSRDLPSFSGFFQICESCQTAIQHSRLFEYADEPFADRQHLVLPVQRRLCLSHVKRDQGRIGQHLMGDCLFEDDIQPVQCGWIV